MLANKEMKQMLNVISPSAPICISSKIIQCPKKVKLLSGIVKRPVIQVADVAVKIMSTYEQGTACAKGSDSKSDPNAIATQNEASNAPLGENVADLLCNITINHPLIFFK